MTTKKMNPSNEQTQVKRLSLDDFKLEKVAHLEVVTAKDLSNVLGGVADPASIVFCGPPMDDCHSEK
jgi:hypothetical protein